MSGQIKLKAASLGGDIALVPTDTASSIVVTIPAGTSTLVTNATLPTQLNASGSAPIYAARAWVNFNGTGTVAIRASGNVSSITDNGIGDYTVNFTTAMSDANFAISGIAGETSGTEVLEITSRAAGSVRVSDYVSETGSNKDSTLVCVIIFR